MNATRRSSPPRSSAIPTMPDAPPATMPSDAVRVSVAVKRASATPAREAQEQGRGAREQHGQPGPPDGRERGATGGRRRASRRSPPARRRSRAAGTSRRSGHAIATASPSSSAPNRYDDGTPAAPSAAPAAPVAAASATHGARRAHRREATRRGRTGRPGADARTPPGQLPFGAPTTAPRTMSDITPRPNRTPRAATARTAPTSSCSPAAPPAVIAVVTFVLAIVGVMGFGIPVLAALVAVLCGWLFRRTVCCTRQARPPASRARRPRSGRAGTPGRRRARSSLARDERQPL